MENKKFKILTINGSPHDKNSNTRAFVEDFVDEMREAGLQLEHEIISLGKKRVEACIGCWNCTKEKACPLKNDDLEEIKMKMLDCDMLILASPVYTNQITAQMKAFFDRLFTWCHIYPLLGKYSLSVVTTGNDGHKESAKFLEKMLATYGTFSFGSIMSIGSFTPGFFPWREQTREKNKKKAQEIVRTILKGERPKTTAIQKKIYRMMKFKMGGIHTVNSLVHGVPKNQPNPSKIRTKIMLKFFKKMKISDSQMKKWAELLSFELSWWRDRDWLRSKSYRQLLNMPKPDGFDIKDRLIGK